MESVTILHNGIELEIQGNYSKGRSGTYDNPPEYGEFEIEFIYYKGEDINELLEAFNIDVTELSDLATQEYEQRNGIYY